MSMLNIFEGKNPGQGIHLMFYTSMLRPALRYCVKPFTMQLKREIEASGRPPSYYPSSACRLKKSVQTNFLTNMGTPHRLLLLPLLYLFGQCPMHLHASPVVTTSP